MKKFLVGIFALMTFLVLSPVAHAYVLDFNSTNPPFQGTGEGPWGEPAGASAISTVGQTFNITSGETLTDRYLSEIVIYANNKASDPQPIQFRLYVAAWDNANSYITPDFGVSPYTGGILYTSGMQATDGGTTLNPYTFSGINLTLTLDTNYIFFLSVSDDGQGGTGIGTLGITTSPNNAYVNGSVFSKDDDGNIQFLDSDGGAWTPGTGSDLAFKMTLTAVPPIPEPGTIMLIGSGLVGLVGLRRKFKKKA